MPLLIAVHGRSGHLGATLLTVVKRIVTHPFNIATFLGVLAAAFSFHAPGAVERMLDFLKNAAAPCALFTLGVTVALRPLKRVPRELPPLLVLKLFLHPAIALAVFSALGPFSDHWMETAVLMASLPPALNCFVLARQYRVYMEQASAGVLVGTVLSVATVTGLLYLIQQKLLPLHLFIDRRGRRSHRGGEGASRASHGLTPRGCRGRGALPGAAAVRCDPADRGRGHARPAPAPDQTKASG